MCEAVSGNGLLPDWHQAISPVSEPMLTYWFCCCYGPVLCISWIVQIKMCIMYFLNWANKDMFKLNLKYPIIWLICLLRYIKFELNWIGIERKWIELELNWKILNSIWIGIELNWKILNPTWIGIELNWKKWIDPSPALDSVLASRPPARQIGGQTCKSAGKTRQPSLGKPGRKTSGGAPVMTASRQAKPSSWNSVARRGCPLPVWSIILSNLSPLKIKCPCFCKYCAIQLFGSDYNQSGAAAQSTRGADCL